MQYVKFTAMIFTSTVLMFIMMYLNTYAMSHIWFSETRTYMALYMGAGMAIVMLIFMWGMYKNKVVNVAIVLGAAMLFAASVYLVRSQASVEDGSWMKAMIPHHSIAILTSKRANIEDVRVRELANSIIATQQKEIKEMEWLIADIKENGLVQSETQAKSRPLPKF